MDSDIHQTRVFVRFNSKKSKSYLHSIIIRNEFGLIHVTKHNWIWLGIYYSITNFPLKPLAFSSFLVAILEKNLLHSDEVAVSFTSSSQVRSKDEFHSMLCIYVISFQAFYFICRYEHLIVSCVFVFSCCYGCFFYVFYLVYLYTV
jgi:hypothetical protein